MTDLQSHGMPFVAALEKKLKEQEVAMVRTMTSINVLLQEMGLPPRYPDLQSPAPNGSISHLRGDEYYGKPMSSAVKAILDLRFALDEGPASVTEIHASLLEGGYQFEAKSEENEKQSLRNILIKNSPPFHKLPNGKYGLISWYPNAREKRVESAPAQGVPQIGAIVGGASIAQAALAVAAALRTVPPAPPTIDSKIMNSFFRGTPKRPGTLAGALGVPAPTNAEPKEPTTPIGLALPNPARSTPPAEKKKE